MLSTKLFKFRRFSAIQYTLPNNRTSFRGIYCGRAGGTGYEVN